MDLANPAYMNLAAQLTNVLPGVQQAVLGQQQIQNNQAALDAQARADAARQAAAKIATTPNMDDASFEQALGPIAAADPNTAMALRRQRDMKAHIGQIIANPNPRAIAQFGMLYPEELKPLKDAWDVLDGAQRQSALVASHDIYGYLLAKQPDKAIAVLESQAAAARQNGEDPSHFTTLIQMVRENPTQATVLAGLNVAAAAGPEKSAEAYAKINSERREDEKQPYAVQAAKADASIKTTEAQFKPQVIQSDLATEQAQRQRMRDQTANEQADLAIKRSSLELDRDKLQSTIQLELEKLDRNGAQLDAGAKTAVNTEVGNSAAASALADRMNNLADRIHGQNMGWGWASTAREAWKGAFGGQDPVSGLRAEYNQLVNAQAVKNLPPGPASDKDIALAKQGFPPSNASGAYLESFLRGMAKMQQAVAAASDRKANWISVNGSLAPVRRDTEIGGVMVPAGTTFTEFNGNAVKRSKQGDTPAGLQSILQKYGGR